MSDGPIDWLRRRAIFKAARRGDARIVNRLLHRGVYVNLRNRTDQTPLHIAARHGHATVVRTLLDAGADPNVREKDLDYTPLCWAVHEGHSDICEMLVKAGTDLSTDGEKLLERARRNNDTATVLLLRQQGAKSWDEDFADRFEGQSMSPIRPSRHSDGGAWWDPNSPANKTHSQGISLEPAAPPRAAPAPPPPPPPRHHEPAPPRHHEAQPRDARRDATGSFIHPLEATDRPLPFDSKRAAPPSQHRQAAATRENHQRIVHTDDPDLMHVVSAWEELPLAVRQGIVALVAASEAENAKRSRHNLVG